MRRAGTALLVAAAIVVSCFAACAQNASTTSASDQPAGSNAPAEFILRQDVRNVVVDVVVTDKHGEPIHSFDKAHFQVLENGVPQDIAYFEEHGSTVREGPAVSRASLPANVHTNVSPVPAAGALVVILLDALNTRSAQQSYVRAQVIDYLKQIPAGTTMAIFTLADDLKMIQGFTSDPAILKAALDGKAYPTPILNSLDGRVSAGSPDRSGGGLISFSSSVATVRSSLNHYGNGAQDYASELRIRYTLDAFNALGMYLSGIPGRKSLVWFTGSVPWTINPDFSLVTDPTGRMDYSQELKKLADVLTVARISVYPVDATALGTPGGYGPDRSSPSFGVHGNGGAFGREEMNSQMELAGSHMSMSNLASATGGFAQYNTNGLTAAVAKVQSIGANYYTIAYSPKEKHYDGSFRKIEVRVGESGVKLEYRRGYYAQDPSAVAKGALITSTNPLHAVMQRGAPDATQIPFRLETTLSPRQPDPAKPADRVGEKAATLKGPAVRYDFHWTVDLRSVAFTTAPDGRHRAELDATVYAYSADGEPLNNIYSVLPLNLEDGLYQRLLNSGLPMKQTLDVPAGLVWVRAGVVDAGTGHTGATEFPMTIQAEGAGPAAAN